MDRRNLLALAMCLPVIATTPAAACSVALSSPRLSGLQNQQVRKLFEAWWERDAGAFKGYFSKTLMNDGSPMEPKLAAELLDADPIPSQTYDVFDKLFTDTRKVKQLTLAVNTAAGVIVGCSEGDASTMIQPDCTGMPKLHLFLVSMRGLNPRSVTHLATTETAEPSKFSIWSEGAS